MSDSIPADLAARYQWTETSVIELQDKVAALEKFTVFVATMTAAVGAHGGGEQLIRALTRNAIANASAQEDENYTRLVEAYRESVKQFMDIS